MKTEQRMRLEAIASERLGYHAKITRLQDREHSLADKARLVNAVFAAAEKAGKEPVWADEFGRQLNRIRRAAWNLRRALDARLLALEVDLGVGYRGRPNRGENPWA